MKKAMCPCNADSVWLPENKDKDWSIFLHESRDYMTTKNVWLKRRMKDRRIRCPECGRRVVCSPQLCHDESSISWRLPEHKPKGWYKKKGRKRETAVLQEVPGRVQAPRGGKKVPVRRRGRKTPSRRA